jgi:aspartate aminotransferase
MRSLTVNNPTIAQKISDVQQRLTSFLPILTDPQVNSRNDDPESCDFIFGNPQEMPLPGYAETLQRWATPQNKDWFAYKMNEPQSQEVVAESLRQRSGSDYQPEDIFMTTGAFAALAICLTAVVDPGDEVIFLSPPWFFYESLILGAGGVPVRVKVDRQTFDLDLEAIQAAITAKTRAIIVNSPNNPTGRIYSPQILAELTGLLTTAQKRTQRPIYLLSDESYNRIVFDGRTYTSPTAFYPHSFLIYTYGKTLLTPGQRIGYIALPPEMPDRELMRSTLLTAQFLLGWPFPNAILQYALPELEKLSIDIPHLQRKRDHLVKALSEMGYHLHTPEGTFYLMPRSPLADDLAFFRLLMKHKIYVLPGAAFEMPGYFRISLTGNDGMIERSLPGFEAALQTALSRSPVSATAR